jgi:hypothetical protein
VVLVLCGPSALLLIVVLFCDFVLEVLADYYPLIKLQLTKCKGARQGNKQVPNVLVDLPFKSVNHLFRSLIAFVSKVSEFINKVPEVLSAIREIVKLITKEEGQVYYSVPLV